MTELNDAASFLAEMLNNTLDISKLEEGIIVFNTNYEPLQTVIDMALNIFKANANKKGVTLKVNYGDSFPALLEFDKSRLMQVVMNLVGNAIKFTPTQGTIEVRATYAWNCGHNGGVCATCENQLQPPRVPQSHGSLSSAGDALSSQLKLSCHISASGSNKNSGEGKGTDRYTPPSEFDGRLPRLFKQPKVKESAELELSAAEYMPVEGETNNRGRQIPHLRLNEIANKMKAHSLIRDYSASSITALNKANRGPSTTAKLLPRKPSYESPTEKLSDPIEEVSFLREREGDVPIEPEDRPPSHIDLEHGQVDPLLTAEGQQKPMGRLLLLPYVRKPRISSGAPNPLTNNRASLKVSKLDSAEFKRPCKAIRTHESMKKTPMVAIQYPQTPARYCKLLQTAPPDGILTLEVSDTGCGIAEADLSRLFKPFSQANKTVHSKFGGTGLGLWLCDKLIKAMKGEIGVTSVMGKGTTFKITLPLKAKTVRVQRHVIPRLR